MTSFVVAGLALYTALGVSSIEGQVVGPNNEPIAHAQVFLEPGLGGVLQDTITSESGHFAFSDVSAGPAGVFAIAPGFGFEGLHLTLAIGDVVPPCRIQLHEATTIGGTIVTHDGKPVEGARITRIGIKGAHKVGVPLAKLRQYGYEEPASDASGAFTLPNIPAGCQVDLKVGHGNYAQEGVLDVAAGEQHLKITLHTGVLLEGEVISRINQGAVGQAAVLIKNAQPPHDTTTTTTGLSGRFSVRLKPGVYLYQAQGAGLRSAGWERLTVTGERPVEQARLYVAGTGSIRGSIRDAVTGNPIRNVRVSLTTNGTTAAVARSGPGGDFQFTAGEGENIVRIDSTPGYLPPANQDTRLTILEGNAIELPGMWLKPLPAYAVRIVDGAGAPVPGALVSVLRPRQLGWYVANGDGIAEIQVRSFPEDGILLGRAEHPSLPQGALFKLAQTQNAVADVQLFDTGTITGRVLNSRGRGLAGVSVGAFFPGESAADATLLWQTVSGDDGVFQWEAVVPGVPQRCAARAGAEASGESATFNLAPGEQKDLGEIRIEGGESLDTQRGQSLRWYTWEVRCGALPDPAVCASSPALILYSSAEDASVYLETLEQLVRISGDTDLIVALATPGNPVCEDTTVPVLSGPAGKSTGVVVVDRAGTVVLESSQIPPLALLRKL